MKEFIDKLISRLEEEADNANDHMYESYFDGKEDGIRQSIEIINELAEEYKDKVMIDGQYCWQTCSATEHCKECNRLCNGSIDYYENYDFMAEEYKVSEMPTGSESFCEWKKGKSSVFPIKTNCGNSIDVNYGYEFCPYCGKKIKVAPYTEGE